MAVRHQLIKRPRDQVWSVLADRGLYGRWVAGTSASHGGEGEWPAEGSTLAYTVRLGPWTGEGRTVVRQEDRPSRLALEVDSGRLGTARVDIEIKPWGEDSLVILDEHPLTGLGGSLHNGALDAVLQLRHRRMLGRLAEVVEGADAAGRSGRRSPSGGAVGRARTAARRGFGKRGVGHA
ncbi:SRPBCC family protein [Streptomyces sp. V4-01]|uniref:SRPBCC family protein n=1 Tax=Actinacidiphila polyblastidii TaxID=3110430 RepID=A0ABU7P3W6_9ACTN|nr:SRPBCC family protein [Streptomyces sp. V4-01]